MSRCCCFFFVILGEIDYHDPGLVIDQCLFENKTLSSNIINSNCNNMCMKWIRKTWLARAVAVIAPVGLPICLEANDLTLSAEQYQLDRQGAATQSLNAASTTPGQYKWAAWVDGKPSVPAIDHRGKIYVTTGNELVCVSNQGKVEARFFTGFHTGLLQSMPVIGPDNTVYVTTTDLSGAPDGEKRVYAIAPGTNGTHSLAWYSNEDSSSPGGYALPIALGEDGSIYAVNRRGILQAYHPSKGSAPFWSSGHEVGTAADKAAPIIGSDGTIYYAVEDGDDCYVYAIDPQGKLIWRDNPYTWHSKSHDEQPYGLALDATGTLYLSTYNGLHAMDAKTGAHKWSNVDYNIFQITSPTIGLDGLIVQGFATDRLRALRPQDGVEQWNIPRRVANAHVLGAVTHAADSTLIYCNTGDHLYGYRWQNQPVLIWDLHPDDENMNHTVALDADGTIYYGDSHYGSLTAIYGTAGPALSPWPTERQNMQRTGLMPHGPQITAQPIGMTLNYGVQAAISVKASGTPPLSYQWFKNDRPLPGQNAASLTYDSVNDSHSGYYHVVVSNYLGVAVSDYAVLTVGGSPLAAVLKHRRENQSLSIRILGSVGMNYRLQTTSQLKPAIWTTRTNIVMGSTPPVIDAGRIDSPGNGFFRVVAP